MLSESESECSLQFTNNLLQIIGLLLFNSKGETGQISLQTTASEHGVGGPQRSAGSAA